MHRSNLQAGLLVLLASTHIACNPLPPPVSRCPFGLWEVQPGVCKPPPDPFGMPQPYDDAYDYDYDHRRRDSRVTETNALLDEARDESYQLEYGLDPFVNFKSLPDNVPQDFWNRTSPPSKWTNSTQDLKFEFLHCSEVFNQKKNIADGNCNYLAGEVAPRCEFHLLIKGTRTVIGTCNMTDHLATWNPINLWTKFPKEHKTLKNGLCLYDIKNEAKYLRITN